jgi:hypothetical protein
MVVEADSTAADSMEAGSMEAGSMEAGSMEAGSMEAGSMEACSMEAGSTEADSMVADLPGFMGMDFTEFVPDSACSTIRTTAITTTANLLLPRHGIIAPTQRAITPT